MFWIIPLIITIVALVWSVIEASDTYGLAIWIIGIPATLLSWLIYFALRAWGVM
jgi:hypothetical protein